MSLVLTTNTFYGQIPVVSTPPSPSFVMTEPISYEFQVVEYMENEKIMKVSLQVKMNTHDQYGNIKTHGLWVDVPRIKLPYVAPVV
jgi:hypothetical protein